MVPCGLAFEQAKGPTGPDLSGDILTHKCDLSWGGPSAFSSAQDGDMLKRYYASN